MPIDVSDILRLIIMASVFVLVLAIWVMAVVAWASRRAAKAEKLERRLEMLALPGIGEGRILRLWSDTGREASTIVPGLRGHFRIISQFEQMRRAAGLVTPIPALVLGIVGGATLSGVLIFMITQNPLVGLCGALAILLIAWIYIQQRIARRVGIFESQLVDALGLAARSLRAGHPLPGAFRMIAQEIPPPIGTVFAEVCQQQDLGMALDVALRKASEESPSPDLKLFATSVVIQLRSGGNLADMMERLSAVIQDRMRLGRRVRVLTAQSQLSKYILLALPFVVFLILNLLNPEFMNPLYTTSEGHKMLAVAAAGLLVGAWAMNRLAVIRY